MAGEQQQGSKEQAPGGHGNKRRFDMLAAHIAIQQQVILMLSGVCLDLVLTGAFVLIMLFSSFLPTGSRQASAGAGAHVDECTVLRGV